MIQQNSTEHRVSRRDFLKNASWAGLGGSLTAHFAFPTALLSANSDTLRIGLIGCGSRGTGAALQALRADPNVILTAMGDAFEDRLLSSLETLKKQDAPRLQVTPDHCFVGFDAYQKVINSGVDVVLLATPPGFRPQHLKAAVEANKHVFCEKPVAVDATGVRSVLATVELARQKKLSLVSGLCWHYCYPERATFQRLQDGAIGELVTVYSTYNAGPIWNRVRQPEWTEMEWQMRNWYYFTWLSGDHIVEQAVHSIDKMCWAMKGEMPTRAVALGGRQVRNTPAFGHIYDHFSVTYEYANGARGFHHCRQQEGCANQIADFYQGSKGSCEIDAVRRIHMIQGTNPWKYEGPDNNMYQTEHDELFASIRKGEPINNGVWMANSTLMAILGREAAYTGQSISWDQIMNSQQDLSPPTYAWDAVLPIPQVAMPGVTLFL
ncbi:MAG: Gfo/Idh/MocA family oxidoreductase [Terriglobia bacterium]